MSNVQVTPRKRKSALEAQTPRTGEKGKSKGYVHSRSYWRVLIILVRQPPIHLRPPFQPLLPLDIAVTRFLNPFSL